MIPTFRTPLRNTLRNISLTTVLAGLLIAIASLFGAVDWLTAWRAIVVLWTICLVSYGGLGLIVFYFKEL